MALGIRWRSHAVLLVLLVGAGVGMLLVQRYAFSLLTSHQTAAQRQVQQLREKGSLYHSHPNAQQPGDLSTKVILMHSFPAYYMLNSGSQHFSTCNHSCTLTLDVDLATDVDCVIFFSHYYQPKGHLFHRPHQVWVYFAVESPFNSYNSIFGQTKWHHFFNWTMTYRRDSDFYFGYGDIVRPHLAMPVRDLTPVVKTKTKLVAWFVSNCKTQSLREDFVSVLKEFVDVDIYGNCGTQKCGKEGNQTCMDMLTRDYHFYLAFENSICKDYVTEKLYRTMSRADVVPVVRGGANYSALLPKNSFIDASQFPSVKALAEHLKKVAGDPQLYEQHLAWKNTLTVVEPMSFPFCDLCYRLHHADRYVRDYPNVDQWWQHDICHSPPAVVKS